MQICLNYNSVEIDRNKLTLTKKGKKSYFFAEQQGKLLHYSKDVIVKSVIVKVQKLLSFM